MRSADGCPAGPKANEVSLIPAKYTAIKDEHVPPHDSGCNPNGEVNVASLKKDLESLRARLVEKKTPAFTAVTVPSPRRPWPSSGLIMQADDADKQTGDDDNELIARAQGRKPQGANAMSTRGQNDFDPDRRARWSALLRRYWIGAARKRC
jgi:hypothetical protein